MAEQSRKTGKVLSDLLESEGVRVTSSGAKDIVSYGVRIGERGLPTLNARAGMADKLEELRDLRRNGVLVPAIYEEGRDIKYPLLARKRQHGAGKDLMVVLQPEEIPWRRAAGASYFVEYIPIDTEYRVWVFRTAHLGTYAKIMDHPDQFKKLGRNFKNGFGFHLVKSDAVPRGAVEAATAAVRAKSLDFGAVDILKGKDGKFYTLEVNTAPGVEGPGRMVIQSLARHIAEWEKKGYPIRKAA